MHYTILDMRPLTPIDSDSPKSRKIVELKSGHSYIFQSIGGDISSFDGRWTFHAGQGQWFGTLDTPFLCDHSVRIELDIPVGAKMEIMEIKMKST